jgi:hypothetical protein
MREDNHIFLKNGSSLFLREGLEQDDPVGGFRKIGFLAHAILRRHSGVGGPNGPPTDAIERDEHELPARPGLLLLHHDRN